MALVPGSGMNTLDEAASLILLYAGTDEVIHQ